jgi:formate dehydrogenase iron-sulfur subunit
LGILATLASAFIYLLPARPSWNLLHTPLDFLISAALLGSISSGLAHTRSIAFTLALASAWVLNQLVRLYRLRTSTMFELRSSYNLLTSGALLPYLYASFGCIVAASAASVAGHPILGVLVCWAGLLTGRYLFFVSVVPLKMGLTFLQGRHA